MSNVHDRKDKNSQQFSERKFPRIGVNAVGCVHGVSNNAKSFAGLQTLESDRSRRRKHIASVIRFRVRFEKQKEIPISDHKVLIDTILTTNFATKTYVCYYM